MKNQITTKRMKWIALGTALAGGTAFAQMPQQPEQPAQPQQPPQTQPAQPAQPQEAQPMEMEPAQPATPEVTDQQLEQAVTAYISVSEIQTRVQEQLAGVDDQAVIEEAVTQARTDMIEAVQEAGMAPAQYEEVMNVVTQDETVRNRFLEMLQEQQAGG
ncbi:MAG: DUF4168 domain-containing protein [Verrucomicrobia bacterium]|nr:DUF4168 domain-containing protein [Verrucomicrobiota bacterium]MCH8528146.1 DUF4168 domain-containing protein [Kiritimatiellia bacterium]